MGKTTGPEIAERIVGNVCLLKCRDSSCPWNESVRESENWHDEIQEKKQSHREAHEKWWW